MSFFPSIIRELRIQAVGFTKLITVTSGPRIWQYHKYMEYFWDINMWMLFPCSIIWPWIDFHPLYFFLIYLLFSPGMFPSMTCYPGKHQQEEDHHLEFHLELSKHSQSYYAHKISKSSSGSLLLLFSFLIWGNWTSEIIIMYLWSLTLQ